MNDMELFDLMFSGDRKTLLCCLDKELDYVEIPPEVEVIADEAFKGCDNITCVMCPYGLKQIGERAFMGCSSLVEFVIPDSVKSIGAEAFADCSKLDIYCLPSYLTRLEKGVCRGCISIKNMTIPNGVEVIGEDAFAGCTSLQMVNFPYFIKKVEKNAFAGCEALNEICYLNENPNNAEFEEGCFDSVNTESCQLFVEEGYAENFKRHSVLGRFHNIGEFVAGDDMYKRKDVQLDEDEIDEAMTFADSCVRVREICQELGIPESSIAIDEQSNEDDMMYNSDRNGLLITLCGEDGFTLRVSYACYYSDMSSANASVYVEELYQDGYPCYMTNPCLVEYLNVNLPSEICVESFSDDNFRYIEDYSEVSEGPARMKEILQALVSYLNDNDMQVTASKQLGYMCEEKSFALIMNMNEDAVVSKPVRALVMDTEKGEVAYSQTEQVEFTPEEYRFLICEFYKNPVYNYNDLIQQRSELACKINSSLYFWVQNEAEMGLKPFFIDIAPVTEGIKDLQLPRIR